LSPFFSAFAVPSALALSALLPGASERIVSSVSRVIARILVARSARVKRTA
jgi:hypothetical protein